jgi:hypothetical protein
MMVCLKSRFERKGPPPPVGLIGLTTSRINLPRTITQIEVSFDEKTIHVVLLGDWEAEVLLKKVMNQVL